MKHPLRKAVIEGASVHVRVPAGTEHVVVFGPDRREHKASRGVVAIPDGRRFEYFAEPCVRSAAAAEVRMVYGIEQFLRWLQ